MASPATGRVLVAPDKFKGSLSSVQAATALKRGIRLAVPGTQVHALPISDGGEGFVELAIREGYRRHVRTVRGPTDKVANAVLATRGELAFVELAQAAGLNLVASESRNPMEASTVGVGDLIRHALDLGACTIALGLGGSATIDGGAGLLVGLGARLIDRKGQALHPTPSALLVTHELDVDALDPRVSTTRFIAAADVLCPLTGQGGAIRTFGAQKGAGPDQLEVLEEAMSKWRELLHAALGCKTVTHGDLGAAGGAAFGLAHVTDLEVVSGVNYALELCRFRDHATTSDVVITGEGSLDRQTLRGKAPMGVAVAAAQLKIPVIAACGVSSLTDEEARAAGFHAQYSVREIATSDEQAMRDAFALLTEVGRQIAVDWL